MDDASSCDCKCFLSVIIIFFERRDPRNVWTWLLVLYFIPILGFLCYFIIGADFHKSKMFRTKEIEDRISNVIRLQETKIVNKEFAELPHGYEKYQDLLMYNLESEGAYIQMKMKWKYILTE